jgi:hypothetical protein
MVSSGEASDLFSGGVRAELGGGTLDIQTEDFPDFPNSVEANGERVSQ